MALPFNDGTVPFGSRVLTINAVTYVAENFEVSEPTFKVERRDEINAPNGQYIGPDFINGSATLQLATSSTAIPALGDTFATKPRAADVANTTFAISEVGIPEEQGAIKKVPIKFVKKYN